MDVGGVSHELRDSSRSQTNYETDKFRDNTARYILLSNVTIRLMMTFNHHEELL